VAVKVPLPRGKDRGGAGGKSRVRTSEVRVVRNQRRTAGESGKKAREELEGKKKMLREVRWKPQGVRKLKLIRGEED